MGRSRSAGRHSTLAAVLVLLAFGAVLLSLVVGSRNIGAGEVFGALFRGVDSDNATVITSQRLPRTLLGVLAGGAFGIAGALMQAHTRNPLADPGLFGVNAGAAFAIALTVFLFGQQAPTAITVAALVGAGAVSAGVFLLGLGSLRGSSLGMLAVLGTTISALLTALTQGFVLIDRASLNTLRFWQVGSLANRDDAVLPLVVPLVVVGVVLAVLNAFAMNALGLGEDVAVGLGTDVRSARVIGIVAIALLAGSATAVCGPITFVGLVAPHAARRLVGPDHRWLVPFAGLLGIVVLLVADTVGRVVAPPGELQAGIVIAVIGAPVLLAVGRRRRLVAL